MTSATSCGLSSWTAWPQRASTWSWNLPCIWPTVSVRSSPSMLANSNNFGTRRSRNFWLRFSNHPDQYFSDLDRSMRHAYLLLCGRKKNLVYLIEMYGNWIICTFYPSANDAVAIFPTNWWYPIRTLLRLLADWWILWRLSLMANRWEWSALPEAVRLLPICLSQCCRREQKCNQFISKCMLVTTHLMICPGIDTLAESTLRICPLRTHHSIACWILLNVCGRDRRKLCMLANASMAVPSTTSMTTHPISDGTNSRDARCTQMAPPIEWPTIIIGGAFSGYILLMIWPTSLQTQSSRENKTLY